MSIELGVILFGGLVLVLLIALRAKRAHDQKLRRAASAGFYDSDAARYATSGSASSLLEKTASQAKRPLAPSFNSSTPAPKGSGVKGQGSPHHRPPAPPH
jgi:hypothetical protein